ncbi:unnamed protein product [Rotaria sp. Silwood2]|nr:unnamed protein product [Rotaria sp. Silwood2]CAF4519216.1 unnamed protein product [Rotaria sp. Silwood2]
MFNPIATSTPALLNEDNQSREKDVADNENSVSTEHLTNLLNSTAHTQSKSIGIASVEPKNAVPATTVSTSILSVVQTGLKGKLNMKGPFENSVDDHSMKHNSERLNRSNFFIKNIATNLNYIETFNSIIAQYPLAESNAAANTPKIKYLCIAGNFLLT